MMKNNTVFVIGAGASKEVNLPSGYELKGKIVKLLDMRFERWGPLTHGDSKIYEAFRQLALKESDGRSTDINHYLQEAHRIKDALPLAISIDNFIDAHRENDKIAICGKLAIARSILQAEKESHLYVDRDSIINYNRLEKTWYQSFFQLLAENCSKNDLQDRFKSITLIIFNYDRCVEHFLYNTLQNYYHMSPNEAATLVNSLNIYHPYGSLGPLPWSNQKDSMGFGFDPSSQHLLQLTEKIKTFTEGTNPDSSEIIEIRKHMSAANKLVFIGFAFHKLNMQLIKPNTIEDKINPQLKCYATTYGISGSDTEVINEQINDLYQTKINIKMANLPCSQFFTEFWRNLSF